MFSCFLALVLKKKIIHSPYTKIIPPTVCASAMNEQYPARHRDSRLQVKPTHNPTEISFVLERPFFFFVSKKRGTRPKQLSPAYHVGKHTNLRYKIIFRKPAL
jgi:hypothetical protein